MTAIHNEQCIICDRPGTIVYDDLPDRITANSGRFSYRRCPVCGLLWLDPRPSPDDIGRYYKGFFDTPNGAESVAAARPLASFRDTLRHAILCGAYGYRHLPHDHRWCFLGPLLAAIPVLRLRATFDFPARFPRFKRDALIVDVGCGPGNYLLKMKELGWNVLGIEPDPDASARAERSGIPVRQGSLENARLPAESVDVITLNHVIEHLPDPAATMAECFRVLKKGGKLILVTPNAKSLSARLFKRHFIALDPPRHFFLFSAKNIRDILEKIPFTGISVSFNARTARGAYDQSSHIARLGRIASPRVEQPGRLLFGIAETLFNSFGLSCGEEIEITATKQT